MPGWNAPPVGVESAVDRAGHVVSLRIRAAVDRLLVSGAGRLRLREQIAPDNLQLCAGLKDAEARLAERKVLLGSAIDELIEHGIVKNSPPLNQLRRL